MFDTLTERDLLERQRAATEERFNRAEAREGPLAAIKLEDATLSLEEKKRLLGRTREYDAAKQALETDMESERVPQTIETPGVPGNAGASGTDLRPPMPGTSNKVTMPLTEQEKNQRRLTLALKYGMNDEITKIGTLVDITNKVGTQAASAMMTWGKSVSEYRKQFGPEAAKAYGVLLGKQMGIQTDGLDFTGGGEIMRRAPNGNYYITKADGSIHEFKPNSDDMAHNTIKEYSPDGTKFREMQWNPNTRRYDIQATGWAKVQKQVANLGINQPAVGEEDLDHYARMYNKYGRSALPFSLRNMPPQLAKRAAELAHEEGKSGEDIGFQQAQTSADKASYAAITKGMDAVNSFEKGVEESIKLVDRLSDKFSRTPIPGINKMTQWMQYHTGDPDVKAFRNALQTAMTEYMKVTTAGMGVSVQELTVGAQQRAQHLHDISDNVQTFKNAFAIMRQEMAIKKRAIAAQRKEIEARMKVGTSGKSGETLPSTGKSFKVDANGNVTEVK